jgi:ubiquinone/menaquinone biosynthesis C-methylase UbiE
MTDFLSSVELTKSYARWRASALGQITDGLERELLFDLLDSVSGKTVLDVGCGDGVLAGEIAHRGGLVTGLDADAGMIAAIQQRERLDTPQLRLITARAEELPFQDAIFDRVLAVTTLCFVEDAGRAVQEMARVLKPGGRLVIGEIGRWSIWSACRRIRGWRRSPIWRAARFRSAREIRRLVAAVGLEVMTMRGAAHYPPFGIAARIFAPFDLWLGRRSTLGSAFIALAAKKPAEK